MDNATIIDPVKLDWKSVPGRLVIRPANGPGVAFELNNLVELGQLARRVLMGAMLPKREAPGKPRLLHPFVVNTVTAHDVQHEEGNHVIFEVEPDTDLAMQFKFDPQDAIKVGNLLIAVAERANALPRMSKN